MHSGVDGFDPLIDVIKYFRTFFICVISVSDKSSSIVHRGVTL